MVFYYFTFLNDTTISYVYTTRMISCPSLIIDLFHWLLTMSNFTDDEEEELLRLRNSSIFAMYLLLLMIGETKLLLFGTKCVGIESFPFIGVVISGWVIPCIFLTPS